MSSGVFTVLSRYSRKSAIPTPPMSPTRNASAILRALAGRAGLEGIVAGSTTKIFDDFKVAGDIRFAKFRQHAVVKNFIAFRFALEDVVLHHTLRHLIDRGFLLLEALEQELLRAFDSS